MSDHIKIKELAKTDRPREKIMLHGAKTLSDAELLGVIIGSGIENMTAVDVARSILGRFGNNLNELGHASIKELMQIKGIGEARAINIIAALEIGRRRASRSITEKPQILCGLDSYNIIKPYLSDLDHEEFWAMFLNKANRVIDIQQIGKGGLDMVLCDVRQLAKMAINNNAISIIVAHNHPSNECKPSQQDIQITNQINNAMRTLNINLLDHIIVGVDRYLSFNEEQML